MTRQLPGRVPSICDLDPAIAYAASARPHRRRDGEPLHRPLRIYSRDAAAGKLGANEVLVEVPYEPLAPGPTGSMLAVEAAGPDGRLFRSADLEDRSVLLKRGYDPSPTDPCFHAQMVYAVSRLTYSKFQTALGREPTWAFPPGEDGQQLLRIRPFALEEENAYYDRSRGELTFGYYAVRGPGYGRALEGSYVFSSLSHDIIVHETTHALLDGLRARLLIPTRKDVLAFHEGFADIVAIFQRFTYKELVRETLRSAGGVLSRAHLLFEIAREFGQTTGGSGALRSPIEDPGQLTLYEDAGEEPHRLGTVLVSAVFEAFQTIYKAKIARYFRIATGRSDPPEGFEPGGELLEALVYEATKLAGEFLNLLIRAIDYCPPVDLSLGEYLRAIITSDRHLVPGDPWGYREAFIDAFARRHIAPPGVPTLSQDALVWSGPNDASHAIEALAFRNLQFSGDPARPAGAEELRSQAHALGTYVSAPQRLELFGLRAPGPASARPLIHSIRTTRRVGPDGQVEFDLVAEITQRHQVDCDGSRMPVYSGSTIVIGPEGELRYVIRKGVDFERWKTNAYPTRRHYIQSGAAGWQQVGSDWVEPASVLQRLHARPVPIRIEADRKHSTRSWAAWDHSTTPISPRRVALCVGINAYPQRPLRGSIRDLENWVETLTQLGYSVVSLSDEEATRSAVLGHLEELTRLTGAGDSIVFAFSGHGTRYREVDPPIDEVDGWDEAICPVDTHNGADILDDDLAAVFDLFDADAHVTVFLDCCHAEGGTRATGTLETETARRIPWSEARQARFRSYRLARELRRPRARVRTLPVEVTFGACLSQFEIPDNPNGNRFTTAVTSHLEMAASRYTNQDFFALLMEQLQEVQIPTLDCHPSKKAERLLFPLQGA